MEFHAYNMFEKAERFMIDLKDIRSVTDFQRNAKEYVGRLKRKKQPMVLTINGRAEVVVQDAQSYQDMLDRVDREDLEVTSRSVLVLKNCGPKGVPGMPEWGSIPVPAKLQKAGMQDLVRISDARMSGTGYGTVILHVCPEAAAGGTLAIVRTGDQIRLDVPRRSLDLLVSDSEIQRRLAAFQPPTSLHLRGYPRLYIDHVLQADQGCDFDFLRPKNPQELRFVLPLVGRS